MADQKYAAPPYPPPQSAPIQQNQPGYGPPYQGAPPPGYQGGAPPGYQGAPPPGYQGAPPPGYQGAPPPGYQGGSAPAYQGSSAPPGYQPVPAATTTYVYVKGGHCPACNVGYTNPEFTILGICLAILFFPIGILCCLLLTEKRCSYCGMTYS